MGSRNAQARKGRMNGTPTRSNVEKENIQKKKTKRQKTSEKGKSVENKRKISEQKKREGSSYRAKKRTQTLGPDRDGEIEQEDQGLNTYGKWVWGERNVSKKGG